MAEELFVHQLDNGLTLLGDRMAHVVSTAVNVALPAGASLDPQARPGAATVLSEWLFRGAGDRDSRQLNDALDALGCHFDQGVRSHFLQISGSQVHQNLLAVLEIFADVAQRPRLAEETFEPSRDLARQDLEGLDDEPSRKVNIDLRERFYPWPLGISPLGTLEGLAELSPDALRAHAGRTLTPHGGILAVAGRFEFDEVCDWAERLFGAWQGPPAPAIETAPAQGGIHFQQRPTAQVQIALACPAPPTGDEHYYPFRVLEMILGGGMSCRLFTEVREKRGLVYAVGARYQGVRGHAGLFVYAGTTPEKAQQTLDVTVNELRRLGEGLEAGELERAKIQLKSALIMQGESTGARVGGLVNDWYLLGRLRPLHEIAAAVDAVSADDVAACLAAWPARQFTASLLGPVELNTTGLSD